MSSHQIELASPIFTRPTVKLVGQVDHPDFRDAIAMLRADAHFVQDYDHPELIIFAQSRPGAIGEKEIHRLQREAPLAGLVGLLGSWCEGESRTGRPWPGVARLYWHEFPAWWKRQLALRSAGRCPDWARLGNFGLPHPGGTRRRGLAHLAESSEQNVPVPFFTAQIPSRGLIVLSIHQRDTAHALTDVFRRDGYATVWQRPRMTRLTVHGASAGIWEGGQLDDREANDLAEFCRTLARDAAPVIALLDFPRRDSVDRALEIGAADVHGKPWRNEELVAQVHWVTRASASKRVA